MNKFSKVLAVTTMAAGILVSGVATQQVSADTLATNYKQVQDISENYLNISDVLNALSKDYSDVVNVKKNNALGDSYGYYLTVHFKKLQQNYTEKELASKSDEVGILLYNILLNKDEFSTLVGSNGLLTLSTTIEVDGEKQQYINTSFMVGEEDVLEVESDVSGNGMKVYDATFKGTFKDVPENHWGKQSIYDLVSLGIVNGSDGKFNPNSNITRGQFAAMLSRSIPNTALVYETTSFKDVSSKAYYISDVQKLNEMGVVSGTSPTTFEPEKKITRQQASAMILRYLEAMGVDTSKVSTKTTFADEGKVQGYAKEAVGKLYNLGIISGSTVNGKQVFDPSGNLTRVQMAKILSNTLKLVVNTDTNEVKGVITDKTFNNCDDLNAVYPEGVSSSHVAYAKKLDTNNDGWACERPDTKEVDEDAEKVDESELEPVEE